MHHKVQPKFWLIVLGVKLLQVMADMCLEAVSAGSVECVQIAVLLHGNSTVKIACGDPEQPSNSTAKFQRIESSLVHDCFVNGSFEDTLRKVGLSRVRTVVFYKEATLAELSFFGELSLTRVEFHLNGMDHIEEDPLPNSTDLRNFVMDGSRIRQLPDNFLSKKKNLTTLSIQHGDLNHLPARLVITSLETLSLQNNSITQLQPTVFADLCNLTTLDLKLNPLGQLDEHIFRHNRALKKLHLTILDGKLPERIFEPLDQLEDLAIEAGLLEHIQERLFWNQRSLKLLSLRNNRLARLEGTIFFNLNVLSTLQLNDNRLSDVPTRILPSNFHRIVLSNATIQSLTIYAAANPLKCDCNLMDIILKLENHTKNSSLRLVTDPLDCPGGRQNVTELNPARLFCDLATEWCPEECHSCRLTGPSRGLLINCSNSGLEDLPQIGEQLSTISSLITLDIRNNSVRQLPTIQDNPGFGIINNLLADGNKLDTWNAENLHENISYISLKYNNLYSLEDPLMETILKSNNLQALFLSNNSWPCLCSVAKQMTRISKKFKQFHVPSCESGQPFTDLNRTCISYVVFSVLLGSVLFTLTVTFSALYYRHKHSIHVRLFTRHICLNCVTHEESNATLTPYDAFISYSHRNDQFVVNELIPTLEKPPHSFKLCIHVRDLAPGAPDRTQFVEAIEKSRRTIIYITKQYLQAQWSLPSYRAAFEQALAQYRSRLIVILAEDVERFDELKTSLRSKTLIERDDPFLWEKLLYAMPHRSANLMRRHRLQQKEKLRKETVLLREKNRHREQKRLGDVAL